MTEMFGIDIADLVDAEIQPELAVVAGRVAHIDGDFAAYQVSCHEDRPWAQIVHNLEVLLETQRLMCGAEKMQIHLTGNGGNKGGRFDQAMLRPYQETRQRNTKPSRLEDIRVYMEEEYGAMYWMDREADDGMAFCQTEAIKRGDRHLSCIVSADKDLRIVQGLHLCPDTQEVHDVDGYGSLFIKEMKAGKKLLGWGPAFFFAQMLMGDPADNIQGLPKLVLKDHDGEYMKPKLCGPVAAYNVLQDCKDEYEAYVTVATLYAAYSEAVGFVNYRDGSRITAKEAFTSEARLLWMRTDANASADDWMHVLKKEVTCN